MKWRLKDLVDKAFEISHETSVGSIHRGARVVFAAEKASVSKGDLRIITIKPLTIPANHLSFMSAYAKHPLGSVIALIDEAPKKLDKPKLLTKAVFHAWGEGEIETDDVVGVVNLMLAERARHE